MVTAYAFQGAGLCRAFRSGLKAAVLLLASVHVALQPPLYSVFTLIYSFTLAS